MDQISDSKTLKDYQDFWLNDAFGDIPFNDELLGGFEAEAYQGTTPCGLPSPNSSNPELPGSGRQSPFLPAMSTFSGVCDLQSFDTNLDPVISHLPQQSFFQESCADIDSNTSNFHPSSNPGFSNGNNNSPQVYRQQGEPSMTSSNFADAGPYQTFTVPIEGPLCISEDPFQNLAAIGQSNEAFDETALFGGAISTQVSNALNNTSCASEAAETQHSLQLKSQHSEYPSHLCNSIHPGLQQDSPFTLNDSASQATHAMSSSHNLINHQAPYTSPSQINHRNVQRSPNGPPHRRIASAHNLNRGSPVSQNHQPIHESKLRTSVASSSLQNNPLETGQIQTTNYSDLQPMSRQQSIRPPYTGHHHVAGLDMNPRTSYSAEHYGMQSSDHPEVSFIGQGSTHFGFNGSSPLSAKREISSPDSEYVATISNSKSQTASPKPQKKGRVKQESRNDNDNEVVVNPIALQTADLTNMSPIDHKNVTALIKAMHNTDNVEDNDGMKKTWLKVRKTKALRIREVCVELLSLAKQAQGQKGTPLGEKRTINQYPSFEKRFEALLETLASQKTVCKHLIEPPYSYSVVDDPQHAKDRVKNNRRVNQQKAEAIRLGRAHLGEKAQGKGRPVLKARKRGHSQIDESDDEDNSGDDPLSDGETDASPHTHGSKSVRSESHTPKRVKRSTKKNQRQEQSVSEQFSYSPQVQNTNDPFTQGLHQNAYAPTQQTEMFSAYNQIPHGYAPSQQMPTSNQQHSFFPVDGSGNLFYGDNSTGASDSEGRDSEGHGITGYRNN